MLREQGCRILDLSFRSSDYRSLISPLNFTRNTQLCSCSFCALRPDHILRLGFLPPIIISTSRKGERYASTGHSLLLILLFFFFLIISKTTTALSRG